MTLVPRPPSIARTLPHFYLSLQLISEVQAVPGGLWESTNLLLKEVAELRDAKLGEEPIISPDACKLWAMTLTLPAAFGELLPETLVGVDAQLAQDLLLMIMFSYEDTL